MAPRDTLSDSNQIPFEAFMPEDEILDALPASSLRYWSDLRGEIDYGMAEYLLAPKPARSQRCERLAAARTAARMGLDGLASALYRGETRRAAGLVRRRKAAARSDYLVAKLLDDMALEPRKGRAYTWAERFERAEALSLAWSWLRACLS